MFSCSFIVAAAILLVRSAITFPADDGQIIAVARKYVAGCQRKTEPYTARVAGIEYGRGYVTARVAFHDNAATEVELFYDAPGKRWVPSKCWRKFEGRWILFSR